MESYSQGTFQRNEILFDAFNGLVWDDRPSILEMGRDIDRFPFDWSLIAVT